MRDSPVEERNMSGPLREFKKAPAGAYARPARKNPFRECALTAAFAAVGGKWKLTLVFFLSERRHHFAGLRKRLSSISHKVLTEQLRELEADGLVARRPLGPVPARVLYELTGYRRTLLPVVALLRAWGREHQNRRLQLQGLPASRGTADCP
jgi:DNA-binding HxlR family transcriptional regulator